MNLLQKYVGAGEAAPKITRLGTNDWAAAKKKASAVLKELASEYIGMYAVRRAVKGYAFSEDTAWQAEFEEKFQYEPTPDQLTSSEEIKRDMQRDVPMDRLLCADVGYGKTEVAVRAAFKAAADSKQTAILVPTTILALQHYNSFVERFKGYPIRIEMMSRFKTSAQIKKIKDCLKKGAVDIVIGTQKILADDIRFKDLGLLIVDEEQRFGVAQKDKLKLMKTNVDTLSLSATPIPRTLHMSLSGIRDMSVIRTPPENRFPVQTYVMQYEDIIVKEAIQNELARGGQVFYVHNRTETIEQRCAHVAALVPGARVVYAHGQMKESALEDIIIRFLNKEFDVLVCTTIIENGIDIINANTIIIEDADRLGLSQLYQLRGRVGRSDVTAYAYMLYRRDAALSEVSSKRLQAIKQFTQFGSGFKIALRDLQIRGSGNILGARQHGNFGNVGYEMYCRLLSQAIDAQKGIEKPAEQATEIDLDIDAYIPASYIESEEERIEAYKKIALVTSEKDFTELYGDLADVYADPPACVLNLLHTALIKSGAQKANIKKLKSAGGRLTIDFFENTVFGGDFIMRLSQSYRFKVKNNGTDTSLVFYLQQDADIIKYTSDLIAIFIGK
jgi:transcription-repair coupling factor (superfamily II helicase)